MKIVFSFFVFLFTQNLFANCLPEDIIEDEYLIRVKSLNIGFSAKSHNDILNEFKHEFETKVIHNQVQKAEKTQNVFSKKALPPTLLHVKDVHHIIDNYKNHPDVLSIENNCLVHLTVTPDDTSFANMWAHQKIESEAGWDISTGSANVIVAISDTGIDYNHSDLKDNMWINDAEKNGQAGVDDDGNGYIDDIYGYDFANNDKDPMDGNGHGTHVAGSVGAKGNNANGVVGVVWTTKLMAVKGLTDSGSGSLDALLNTIYYAADNGANVINCSWGGERSPIQSERDAFDYAISKGVVPVVAAGNSAKNSSGFSPAGISSVLTVGASTPEDGLASFSNFGNVVDVIAPGTSILSTWPTNVSPRNYNTIQGTSMASPHVAGLAALTLSINPNLGVDEVMNMIKDSGDMVTVTAANNVSYTYPRINVLKLAQAAYASLPVDPPCTGEQCSSSGGIGRSVASALPEFNSNGCSYSVGASSSSGPYLLLLPFLILFIRRKK